MRNIRELGMALVLALSSCATTPTRAVATPANIQLLGDRTIPQRSPDEVRQAAVTALRLMGFEIVTVTPRIRTNQRVAGVTAVASAYQAQAFAETIAWEVGVDATPSAAAVTARLHHYVNGMESPEIWVDTAEQYYNQLYREIRSNLPAPGSAPSPATAPAPAPYTQ